MTYTTKQLVLRLMSEYNIKSKYGVAKLLKSHQSSVANWLDHGTTFDDKTAYKVAQLLDIDYEYLLICMNLERAAASPRARKAWQHVADTWNQTKVAALALVSAPLFVALSSTSGGLI